MKLTTLVLGAASGYSLARVIEAKATGVPLGEVFKLDNILRPVAAIKGLLQAAPAGGGAAQAAMNQIQVIDVTPVA